jgi:hypothetical protein
MRERDRETAGVTSLEILLALVLACLGGVSYLQLRAHDAGSRRAVETVDSAAAVAAAAVAEARARPGGPPADTTQLSGPFVVSTSTVPWRGRVRDLRVTVALPNGDSLTVHRLVSRR